MKKSRTRTILLVFLVTASLGAYLFLAKASVSLSPDGGPDHHLQYEEELEEPTRNTAMPDLLLLQRMLEAARQLIPAS